MKQLRFLLGVSGGVAAFKAAELTRLLIKAGHQVQIVMTTAATQFVNPVTFQALSQQPVYTDMWDNRIVNNMAHIDLSRSCDAIIIAPATANIIAKIAHGIADDLLSTLCAARRCPLFIAPAMNREMWANPANLRNIDFLQQHEVGVLGPDSGEQACGEVGAGRMLEPEAIFAGVLAQFQQKKLAGIHILLTAGPTFERIDPVRGITNLSSGKMGYALAAAAHAMGATVTLVSGPTHLSTPVGCVCIAVESAREMYDAVMAEVKKAHIFIAVAAVADYYVVNAQAQKIKKEAGIPALQFASTPDILQEVAAQSSAPFCVGFAAESDALLIHARAKRARKKVPLLIANLTSAIGSDDNAVVLLDDRGEHYLNKKPKTKLAAEIMLHIAALYQTTKGVV
jgi:phosphopantothenoylcysteine decarboxylase/phosphopantothenate--cysteine ligase